MSLAIASKYISAQADFAAIEPNPHFTPAGITARAQRGQKAANGGDISQTGTRRLVIDPRMQSVYAKALRAYFQPDAFSLCIDSAVAARVTLTMPEKMTEKLSAATIKKVQEALLPKEDLSKDDVLALVKKVEREQESKLQIARAMMSGHINSVAATNLAIGQLLVTMSTRDGAPTGAAATVMPMGTNEAQSAMTSELLAEATVDDLMVLAQQTKGTEMEEHATTLLGFYFAEQDDINATGFAPFSEALAIARTDNQNVIPEDLVSETVCMKGYTHLIAHSTTAELNTMGLNNASIKVEVVKKRLVAKKYINAVLNFEQQLTDDDYEKLQEANEADPRAMPAGLAPIWERVRNAPVNQDVDWVNLVTDGEYDDLNEQALEEFGVWVDVTASIAEKSYIELLGKYAIAANSLRTIRVNNLDSELANVFSVARMNTIDHKLIGDSDEVRFYNGLGSMALSEATGVALLDCIEDNLVGQLIHATAHIGFMKSGHHATANNIANTLEKISKAVGISYTASALPGILGAGVYFGTHTADQRSVAVFFRALYQNNDLSFGIGRRITPHGPGTVSIFLLNLLMDQLHQAGFFHASGQEQAYRAFKATYQQYWKNAHLEVPYAKYMYGASRPESVELKQNMGIMYAYVDGLRSALPNSTYVDSVALSREGKAAASNSLVATIEAQVFVKTFKRYLAQNMERRIAQNAGVEVAPRGAVVRQPLEID